MTSRRVVSIGNRFLSIGAAAGSLALLAAVVLMLWPPEPSRLRVHGRARPADGETVGWVSKVEANTIHVNSGPFGGGVVPLVVTKATRITVGAKEGWFEDIRPGGQVKVAYELYHGRRFARSVELLVDEGAKRPARGPMPVKGTAEAPAQPEKATSAPDPRPAPKVAAPVPVAPIAPRPPSWSPRRPPPSRPQSLPNRRPLRRSAPHRDPSRPPSSPSRRPLRRSARHHDLSRPRSRRSPPRSFHRRSARRRLRRATHRVRRTGPARLSPPVRSRRSARPHPQRPAPRSRPAPPRAATPPTAPPRWTGCSSAGRAPSRSSPRRSAGTADPRCAPPSRPWPCAATSDHPPPGARSGSQARRRPARGPRPPPAAR